MLDEAPVSLLIPLGVDELFLLTQTNFLMFVLFTPDEDYFLVLFITNNTIPTVKKPFKLPMNHHILLIFASIGIPIIMLLF